MSTSGSSDTPNPPRYVWVVKYDAYGDSWISGIFDSEEKAKAYEEQHDPVAQRRYEWQHDYVIDRWKVQ